jgi:hypothetical protein
VATSQENVYRAPERFDALVAADDATCSSAPRNPLPASMAIASLAMLTMTSRKWFLKRAAAATGLVHGFGWAGRGQGGERQWGDQADARTDGRRDGE